MSQTKLGQSLLKALECKAETVDECLQEISEAFTSMSMEKLAAINDELVATIMEKIAAVEYNPTEDKQSILASPVRAIFAYGTLRADITPDGDLWGVMAGLQNRGVECIWHYGRIANYALHQHKELEYPFATQSIGGSVYGTLLSWPGHEEAFAHALSRCNAIEGFEPEGNGLYMRNVVNVSTEDGADIVAYVYYQEGYDDGDGVIHFPDGDWLKGRG